MKLVTGNKNYSSWSLRSWLLLTHLGVPFEEETLSFNDPTFKARVRRYSPVGKVPVLIDGETIVWDTLAIAEYVAEKLPDRGVWPQDPVARARARSICAEMHAGFGQMRDQMPMNCELRLPWLPADLRVRHDIARIIDMWTDCRARFGAGGPFLFGAFTAADAYFAPVVRRFLGFDVTLPPVVREYVATIDGLPAMRAWMTAALAEHDFFVPDEPYRERPARG
jgi:glutathione S-transferase